MTTSAYKPLTAAEQIFKDLVWDPGIKTGELALEGVVPFFALPVVSTLEEGVINELSDWLYNQFVLLVDVTTIRLVNTILQAAYEDSSIGLAVLAQEKGIDSDEFKTARIQALADLSSFTRFGSGMRNG